MTITLLQGDCLDWMCLQPDKAFDCVVTDPPYGIGENNRKNLSRANMAAAVDYGEFTWDSQPATQEQISEIIRLSRNQVIFGGNYFSLPPSSALLRMVISAASVGETSAWGESVCGAKKSR